MADKTVFTPQLDATLKLSDNGDGTYGLGISPLSDFDLQLAKGNIPGHSSIIIRGHNPSQSSASGTVDIAEMGDLSYLASAEQMNIVSDDANDDEGDTGLRTLLIQGVDNDGVAIQEVITMNGTSNVLTSLSYLRVNSIIGLTAGSSGWNEGAITATAASAATIQDEMGPTESISQASHYTVPLGTRFFLSRLELNSARISGGGGSPEVEFKGYARIGGAGSAWLQLFDKKLDTEVTDELDLDIPGYTAIPARTDIRMRADTDTNSTETRTRMYGLVVEDGF